MIVDNVQQLMKKIEKLSLELGDAISSDDYYIEDMGRPHERPHRLPTGYGAVYLFVYGSETEYEFLKIGRIDRKSNARFVSQHYGFGANSTLARSICSDKEFQNMGVDPGNVKDWMLKNLHRINVYVKASCGKTAMAMIEAVFHYAFRPRYER